MLLPHCVGFIMDGNRRWATSVGKERLEGHAAGFETFKQVVRWVRDAGIAHAVFYAFSTENWKRPKTEVLALMEILIHSLRKEAPYLNKNNIKLEAIGQIDRFPKRCINQLEEARQLTANNDRLQLTLALSYSGRWDITEALKSIAREVADGKMKPEDISDETVTRHLSTAGIPDPDLIIRTSGEFRISNFLLWQLAYSELYITQTYWPDFRRTELYEAIRSFQKRDRRFGGLTDAPGKTEQLPKV